MKAERFRLLLLMTNYLIYWSILFINMFKAQYFFVIRIVLHYDKNSFLYSSCQIVMKLVSIDFFPRFFLIFLGIDIRYKKIKCESSNKTISTIQILILEQIPHKKWYNGTLKRPKLTANPCFQSIIDHWIIEHLLVIINDFRQHINSCYD